jgi:hypothetical protein
MVRNPISHVSDQSSDDGSWRRQWIFPKMNDEDLGQTLYWHGIERQYAGPGRAFKSSPDIIHKTDKIIVRQFGGYDI